MLRVGSHYLWDSWVADDGELYHLFFLMAPRSLGHTGEAARECHRRPGHFARLDQLGLSRRVLRTLYTDPIPVTLDDQGFLVAR